MSNDNYSITIEVDDKTPLAAADVDRIHDQLEAFDVSLGMSRRGWRSATLTTPAGSMRQAMAIAVSLVESAFGAAAIAVEGLTEAEFDVRQGWAPVPDLVSVAEAAALLGVTRQRVQQRINEHSLPATRVGATYVLPRAAVEAAYEAGDSTWRPES